MSIIYGKGSKISKWYKSWPFSYLILHMRLSHLNLVFHSQVQQRNQVMKKLYLLFLLALLPALLMSQVWQEIDESDITRTGERKVQPINFRLAKLADTQIKDQLWQAPLEFDDARKNSTQIEVMLHDGSIDKFNIVEYIMMEEGLRRAFPDFKTFLGTSVSNPYRNIRIDYTLNGFRAVISEPGKHTYIDPYQTGDLESRIIYIKKDITDEHHFKCLTERNSGDISHNESDRFAGDCQLRTYRLAVAATGEYTVFHGGTVTDGQAAIVTAMNRINQVFEQDISVRMILIANNQLLVYTDGSTDPYTNNNASTLLDENIANVNSVIGSANYDIGHVFCTTDSGVALTPSVCSSSKAGGVTGQVSPTNDPFWIDYVAHEMGHQFGASHVQNNPCNRADPSKEASVEPGSGSSIMGYAGICSPNVQNNSDPHFNAKSIEEMTSTLNSTSCASVSSISNAKPVINAVQNYTVPKSTFLVLEASATDSDGDALTYCWEQMDHEVGTMPPQSTNSVGPVFRSISPSSSGKRYLPNINAIVSNTTPTWEVLPSVGRSMHFRATVRDHIASLGCTDETDMTVTVDGSSGPFLASESVSGNTYTGGQSITYTWTVAGTDSAPVSCSNVDILLSTDGGLSYPTTVLANTPNDGSQSITIPSLSSTTARLMVRCSDNIFFDINNADFTITGGAAPGFSMSTSPSSGTVCNSASEITYTLNTTSIGGYSEPIGLTVSGLPTGASITASPATITPGNSSNIVISNFGSNTGTFNVTLNGTSGGNTETADFALTLIEGPAVPVLSAPINNATNQSTQPTLDWESTPSATSYNIRMGSSPGGSDVFQGSSTDSEISLTGLSHNTTYYWSVNAVNNCSTSAYSSDFSFTTGAPSTETCTTFMSTDIPKPISHLATTVSTLTISGVPSDITDLNVVDLKGTHTYIQDLTFSLKAAHLNDQTISLLSRVCEAEDDFHIDFDDEGSEALNIPCPPGDGNAYKPADALSGFDGKNANGTWSMNIVDGFTEDEGQLTSWGLEVCYENTGDFTLALNPSSGTTCNNSTIQFDVASSAIGGFSDDITLSASGLPAGANASFSTNPLRPGSTSTVTLSNFGANTGNFTVQISGVAGGITKTVDYTLTLNGTADVPTLTSPANNATGVTASSVTLNWNTVGGATAYFVEVGTSPNGGNIVANGQVSSNAASVSNLAPGTQYYWRVRSINPCGESNYSSDFTFTTAAAADFDIAINTSSQTVCNSADVVFTVSSTDIGGWSHPIGLSTNISTLGLPAGASTTFSHDPLVAGSSSTVTLSNLDGVVGTFTIEVTATSITTERSASYTFTLIGPPDVPTFSAPVNNASDVAVSPTLSWNASNGAATYDVQVSANSDFSNPVYDANVNGTQTNISGLSNSTTYYWRARAVNSCGNSAFSSGFTFTTVAAGSEVCNTFNGNVGAIVDNTVTSYSNTVSGIPSAITDISIVNLVGTHTFMGDLSFTLSAPNGGPQDLSLYNLDCGAEENFDIGFDDEGAEANTIPCPPTDQNSYKPVAALSDFDGIDANGDWTLKITDDAPQDEGNLISWGLKVCYETTNVCDLTVTNSNPTGQASLMDAVDCAESGNTITIDLPENTIIDLGSMSIDIQKNLIINSNNPVTIQCTSANPALKVLSGSTLHLKNITIQQGI